MSMPVPKNLMVALAVAAAVLAAAPSVAGNPETVAVGNPGNAASSTGHGAVRYAYRIGKFEVTNDQYCEFLNAVAKQDRHGLYEERMAGGPEDWGGIDRNGTYGSYSYSVRGGKGEMPVNYVTYESALRYCNWLTNGKKDGGTESGAYTFADTGLKLPDHAAVAVGASVTWVLPTEDEWVKAAYYDPNKAGGAGYWNFPVRSDTAPQANLNTNAPSKAGSYASAASPYGTFDQGGNVWEYNESRTFDDKVGLRGGSFYINDNDGYMQLTTRYDVYSAKWPNYGFRVVALGGPEAK